MAKAPARGGAVGVVLVADVTGGALAAGVAGTVGRVRVGSSSAMTGGGVLDNAVVDGAGCAGADGGVEGVACEIAAGACCPKTVKPPLPPKALNPPVGLSAAAVFHTGTVGVAFCATAANADCPPA